MPHIFIIFINELHIQQEGWPFTSTIGPDTSEKMYMSFIRIIIDNIHTHQRDAMWESEELVNFSIDRRKMENFVSPSVIMLWKGEGRMRSNWWNKQFHTMKLFFWLVVRIMTWFMSVLEETFRSFKLFQCRKIFILERRQCQQEIYGSEKPGTYYYFWEMETSRVKWNNFIISIVIHIGEITRDIFEFSWRFAMWKYYF